MKIIALKLRSSEEVVGTLVEKLGTDDKVRISKPRLIVPYNTGDGRLAPAFMPWIMSNVDGEIEIDKNTIVAQVDPIREVEQLYLKNTSSIALVS